MDGEYDYDDISQAEDHWGWNNDLTPVIGFGFFPQKVNDELDAMTQEILYQDVSTIPDLHLSNFSASLINQFKCTILNETWQFLFPRLTVLPEPICHPTWDEYEASCLPPTPGGRIAIIPCMLNTKDNLNKTFVNATRHCLPTGQWDLTETTNNLACHQNKLSENQSEEGVDISIMIYLIGYSVSLSALLGALLIFFSFRELRCLRHKIHIGLFTTLFLTDISWIFTAIVQNLIHYNSAAIQVWCINQVILRYFHLATFFWMFLEGLYLFLQVQIPFSLVVFKHVHCLLIGWGLPFANMIVWSLLRILNESSSESSWLGTKEGVTTDSMVMETVLLCPFLEERDEDFYAYKIPVSVLLLLNTFFLLWIMLIVVSKLHFQNSLDFDRRHIRAVKALVIVIPVLGFTYILTLLGPSARDTPIAYTIFQAVRAALLSTQGAVITLPYCYLNTEVKGILTIRWKRWKMIRILESECQPSSRNTLDTQIYQREDTCVYEVSPQHHTEAPVASSEANNVTSSTVKNNKQKNNRQRTVSFS